MKPSDLAHALTICIKTRQPVCTWGKPGVGKSQVHHQVAKQMGLDIQDVRAVLLDPVDLRGLPHINGDGHAHWAIPEFLPRDGEGIFFLDELNRAPVLVQNACFQLILDRKLGEYTLPEGWIVAAACNYESDGGGITRMSSALANRFIHLDCEPDLDDWCRWAVQHLIEPSVIAFLRFRPELLHQFSRENKSFPSPRSWEFISRITAQSPGQIEHLLYRGAVGEGAAAEYSSFLQLYRNVPDIDLIVSKPNDAPVPAETDAGSLFAVASALGRKATSENFEKIIIYLSRMPTEYAVMSVKDAVERDNTLGSTKAFTEWAIKHSDVILF